MDNNWLYIKTYMNWEVWYLWYYEPNQQSFEYIYKLVDTNNYCDVYPTKKIYHDLSLMLQDAINTIIDINKSVPYIQKIRSKFPEIFDYDDKK